jgi:hypothetical protein
VAYIEEMNIGVKAFYGEALRRRLLEDLVRDIWTVHALYCVTLWRQYSLFVVLRNKEYMGRSSVAVFPIHFPQLVGPQSSVLKCTF